MKIAITGHRPNKLGNDYNLTSPLLKKIESKLQSIIDDKKPTLLITGMALGIDTLWAKLAIKNNIPFIAAIPCEGHESRWPDSSKKIYYEILTNPLCTIHYVSEEAYTNCCMQKRNEYMVDECDLLIAVWDGTAGGTYNCVKYAKEQKREIIRIKPNEI